MAISDSHYLLSAGVYLGNYSAMYGNVDGFDSARNIYKGVTIHSIDSQMMSIFVIPQNCLPYVEYIGVSQTANLKPLDDADTSLYSNLDQILAPDFERSTFFLTLARGVRITSLKSGYKCIRLDELIILQKGIWILIMYNGNNQLRRQMKQKQKIDLSKYENHLGRKH